MAEGPVVAGLDGCPGGWVMVLWDGSSRSAPVASVITDFAGALATAASVIAVDMPIGFPDTATERGRECESEARRRLGPRKSSVFPVPSRAAVMADGFPRACSVNLEHSTPPRSVTIYCYNLFPKMRQIDGLITPALQSRVFETHPELAFCTMNGGLPVPEPKKLKGRRHPPGLQLRKNLLAASGFPVDRLKRPECGRSLWAEDDLLDACAAAWSARRIRDREHLRLPAEPGRDGRGLRMEINA